MQRLVEKVKSGERLAPCSAETLPAETLPAETLPAETLPAGDSDPFALLAQDLEKGQQVAQNAVLQVAILAPGPESDHRVEVFVNIARRMQSLVHREIKLLDELEAQVEDPDLLKGLFTVDHLATRMRRQSESLAVLGGATSRRQWSRPVTMYEVLRSAVAEVERYSRVKVVPPIEGTLDGSAVADVIHLIAELVENATKFSPPHTQVFLRAENVTAGLVIEVEDRGLGMPTADQRRMNGLLTDPGRINLGELLRDGRIGLFVVSALARRHGVKVQLQTNVYGGIQAVVVLPKGLVNPISQDRRAQPRTLPAHAEAIPAVAVEASAGIPAAPPRPESAPLMAEAPLPVSSHGNGSSSTASGQYATDGRPTLPVRKSGVQGSETPVRNAPTGPAADFTSHRRPDNGERPPLPERRVQTHLAPQLRDAPATTRHGEPVADHIPGLMAAFQGGVSRAEEENESDPSDHTDRTS
jgi:anti-sigma regulatory factor (Ser/Thr protein kinase)